MSVEIYETETAGFDQLQAEAIDAIRGAESFIVYHVTDNQPHGIHVIAQTGYRQSFLEWCARQIDEALEIDGKEET